MATKVEKIPETAICPFTGRPIEIVYSTSLLQYKGVAPFYCTKWFKTKRELMWHLLAREGKAPDFPRVLHIEIRTGAEQRERDEQIAADAREAMNMVASAAEVSAKMTESEKRGKKR